MFEDKIQEWSDKRVLVIGDVMLDKYTHGTSTRISPEAPVPVINVESKTYIPGGAANVAMCIARLGAFVTLVSVVGRDREANVLEHQLRAMPKMTVHFFHSSSRCTTMKERVVVGNMQVARLDIEDTHDISPAEEIWIKQIVRDLTIEGSYDAIVLSDYAKGVLTIEVCSQAIYAANELPIVIDPKRNDFSRYAGATVICPNRKELSAEVERSNGYVLEEDNIADESRRIMTNVGISNVLLTLAEKGMMLISRDKPPEYITAKAREVRDVCGAGDVVTAVIALSLACGMHIGYAAQLASIAAGLAVEKVGTQTPDKLELLSVLGNKGKIKTAWTDLAVLRDHHRLVFTNGCFDLLHRGHIHILEEAKRLGDKLIVAIDTDESVRQLKGPSRPLVSEQDRMSVIAALECVDAVVPISSQGELRSLVNFLMPEVMVKGSDYTNKKIVGADLLHSWGGELKLIPLLDGYSTSSIVQKISTI